MTKEFWDNVFKEKKGFSPMNLILLNRVLDFVKSYKIPKMALDVGCGSGDLVLKLSKLGLDTTGIDFSDVALEKTKSLIEDNKIQAKLIKIDLNNSKFSISLAERFDIIFCKLVYAFISDKEMFFENIKNLLSENGSFILITPVLYKGIEYDKRLKGISVDYEETLFLLKKHFKSTKVFTENFFEEKGVGVVFIMR